MRSITIRKHVASRQRALASLLGVAALCRPLAAEAAPVLDEDGFVTMWDGTIDGSFERIRPNGQVDDYSDLQLYLPPQASLKARFDTFWSINKTKLCDAIKSQVSGQGTNIVCTPGASGELRAKPGTLDFRYVVPNNYVSFDANQFTNPNFFGNVDVVLDLTLTNYGTIEGHDLCDDSDLSNPQPLSACAQVLMAQHFSPLAVGSAVATLENAVFTSLNFLVSWGNILQVDESFNGQSMDVSSSLQSTATSFNAALRLGARLIGDLLFMDDTVHPPPFTGAFQLSIQAQADGKFGIRYSIDERPPPPPPCWETFAGCSQNGPPSRGSKSSVPPRLLYDGPID